MAEEYIRWPDMLDNKVNKIMAKTCYCNEVICIFVINKYLEKEGIGGRWPLEKLLLLFF